MRYPAARSVVLGAVLALTAAAPAGPVAASAAAAGAAQGTAAVAAAIPATASAPLLRPGDRGPRVLEVQRRLGALGYWLGPADGIYGTLTQQAVLALQGAAGLRRDGVIGPNTRAALDRGALPRVRSQGDAVEIDLSAGTLTVVRAGRAVRVLHTSTGTFQPYTHAGRALVADTPRGSWTVSWAVDGWRNGPLGNLYRPRYFHRDGIAVHGYPVVPAYPASHGCARVTNAAMDMIWRENLLPVGSRVLVF
jgi:lipoprotein-anchoring transpeptidase ErfK/SrfK